jgi:hypothetical protein
MIFDDQRHQVFLCGLLRYGVNPRGKGITGQRTRFDGKSLKPAYGREAVKAACPSLITHYTACSRQYKEPHLLTEYRKRTWQPLKDKSERLYQQAFKNRSKLDCFDYYRRFGGFYEEY